MIEVAVGIIFNSENKVLIAKRPMDKYQGGLWEFPGGKIEVGETSLQGLQRELFEEIDIHILSAEPFMQVKYHYSDKSVLLDTWKVTEYSGEPRGKESQDIAWVNIQDLHQFDFPEGNRELIKQLSNT